MTRGLSSTTSGTDRSRPRCAIPRWRLIGSRASGKIEALVSGPLAIDLPAPLRGMNNAFRGSHRNRGVSRELQKITSVGIIGGATRQGADLSSGNDRRPHRLPRFFGGPFRNQLAVDYTLVLDSRAPPKMFIGRAVHLRCPPPVRRRRSAECVRSSTVMRASAPE